MNAENKKLRTEQTTEKELYGILAEFRNPAELIKAAGVVKSHGYSNWDTFSPFFIHGMDKAMGLKKSRLGKIVMGHGLVGCIGALAMMYFMMVIDYPLNISGKTLYNFPAWIPVTFELTVLLSAFGTVFGLFALCGLPRFNHPLFSNEHFSRATDDGFFVCIEATDAQFEAEKVSRLFKDAGATNVSEVYDE